MPSGVYLRTEKHSFNRGRKHLNRKRPVTNGLTPIHKLCEWCGESFVTNCLQPKKKFCSLSCNSKSRPEMNLANLEKRDKEKQRLVVQSRTGERHPNWIKDRSLIKLDKERGGPLHKQWSRNVKKRDSWKCKLQGEKCGGKLESHHILSWKDNPELRYETENGITLCHQHHPRKREDEIMMAPLFKTLLTSAKHI